jgi:hypothetical protein
MTWTTCFPVAHITSGLHISQAIVSSFRDMHVWIISGGNWSRYLIHEGLAFLVGIMERWRTLCFFLEKTYKSLGNRMTGNGGRHRCHDERAERACKGSRTADTTTPQHIYIHTSIVTVASHMTQAIRASLNVQNGPSSRSEDSDAI